MAESLKSGIFREWEVFALFSGGFCGRFFLCVYEGQYHKWNAVYSGVAGDEEDSGRRSRFFGGMRTGCPFPAVSPDCRARPGGWRKVRSVSAGGLPEEDYVAVFCGGMFAVWKGQGWKRTLCAGFLGDRSVWLRG